MRAYTYGLQNYDDVIFSIALKVTFSFVYKPSQMHFNISSLNFSIFIWIILICNSEEILLIMKRKTWLILTNGIVNIVPLNSFSWHDYFQLRWICNSNWFKPHSIMIVNFLFYFEFGTWFSEGQSRLVISTSLTRAWT